MNASSHLSVIQDNLALLVSAMILFLVLHLLIMIPSSDIDLLIDFHPTADLDDWRVVDDGVMGGISQGTLQINGSGNGVFKGEVSLENNGGFSSIRYLPGQVDVRKYRLLVLRVRGDGKNYQCRLRAESRDRHIYKGEFTTSGEWETIEVPLVDLVPSFRGNILDMPNFDHGSIAEFGILIANKRRESFHLEIDWVGFK